MTARRSGPTPEFIALLGVSGVGWFVVVVTALHLLPTGLDPVGRTVSEYVNQPYGWLVPLAGLGMALGSVAVTLALSPLLAHAGAGARAGLALLALWSGAMLIVAAFPADPARPRQAIEWTPAGVVHVVAGGIAFVSLALAAVLVSRSVPAGGGLARAVHILGVAAPVSLVLFLVTLVNRPPVSRLVGAPAAYGLGERLMVGVYASWLICTALWVRSARRTAHSAAATG